MKLTSYKIDFFKPVLAGSLIMHGVLFAAGSGFFQWSPHFGVTQGVNSIDVFLEENELEQPEEKIALTTVRMVDEKVFQKEVKPEEKINQTIMSESQERALSEDDPLYLKNPAPAYPRYAREQGWEGVVILKVLVDANGACADIFVETTSGYQILDESALKTVQNWRFSPASAGKIAFSSWIRIPIRFLLKNE